MNSNHRAMIVAGVIAAVALAVFVSPAPAAVKALGGVWFESNHPEHLRLGPGGTVQWIPKGDPTMLIGHFPPQDFSRDGAVA